MSSMGMAKSEYPMRRADKQVTDPARIRELIDMCEVCRIGFNDNGEVYIVPISFGYEYDGEDLTLYFHGASTGRKLDLIETSPYVGFEMDTRYQLAEAIIPCNFTVLYSSIIGNGQISRIEEREEKRRALDVILAHYTEKHWEMTDPMIDKVAVFKIVVAKMTVKEKIVKEK